MEFGPEPAAQYVAMIGDIVASRKVENRAAFQRKLVEILRILNEEHQKVLVGRLDLTTGDEFQGLFHEPVAALSCIIKITEQLHPIQVIFGIGWGAISTDIHERSIGRMDGPCFHQARDALRTAHEGRMWVAFRGFSPHDDSLLTVQFSGMKAIRDRWTERQGQLTALARKTPAQKDVAIRLGVSPSVVSEALKAASFREILDMEAATSEHLAGVVGYLRQRSELKALIRKNRETRDKVRLELDRIRDARAEHSAELAAIEKVSDRLQRELIRTTSERNYLAHYEGRRPSGERIKAQRPDSRDAEIRDLMSDMASMEREIALEQEALRRARDELSQDRLQMEASRKKIQMLQRDVEGARKELESMRSNLLTARRE